MTIFGPDVSDYQKGLSLNGATFVIAKATEGTSWTATTYPGFKAQATQLGIPFAAYHYMDGSDLQAQAQHAYDVIGPDVPMMVDAEVAADTIARVVELVGRYRALGGKARLVYFPRWDWQQLGAPDLTPLATAGLVLISSSYPAGGYSDDGPGWQAYGGMTPALWQYTDHGPLNGAYVDFNAFKGTVEQLRALLEGDDMSTADIIVGESELWSQAAARSTPTGRNFANYVYAVVSAAMADEFAAIKAELADLKTALAAVTPAPAPAAALTAQDIAHEVLDEEAARMAQ